MRTTQQWWNEVSQDPAKMISWLKNQYHSEATAAVRVRKLLIQFPHISDRDKKLITRIGNDEERHAALIKPLLLRRGVRAEILTKEERYWDIAVPDQPLVFEQVCAIGYHVETMSLDRLDLLAQDSTHADIAEVFAQILPDEFFHQQAFKAMSTPEWIETTRHNHNRGKSALGLFI